LQGNSDPRSIAVGRLLSATLPLLALSCSLTRFDHQECSAHSQCRESFGFGAVCGSQGYCEDAAPIPRCSTAFPDDVFSRRDLYRDAIVIGSLMDHSSLAHLVREKAIRLAVKQASKAGGLDGRRVAAVFCDIAEDNKYDTLSRSAAAVSSAKYLSDRLGVPAIVGPLASDDTQQVWENVRGSTVVMSPAATSLSLAALESAPSDDQPGSLWRVAPPDSLQGEVIAKDMIERGVKSAMVIRETGLYGDGLAQVFQDRFTALGGTAKLESLDVDSRIGEATATAAADSAQEVLFISSQQDWVIRFLNAASTPGLEQAYLNKGIFLTDAAANEGVLVGAAAASSLFPRVRGTRPAPRDPNDHVLTNFAADYRAEYTGEDATTTTFSAHSYDGAWLVLYGAVWSLFREGRVTELGVAHGLRKVSASGMTTPLTQSSWLLILKAFREGNAVNVSGASGELDFDPTTKNVIAPIQIWNITSPSGQPVVTEVAIRTPGG
jgi:branched-chain amino acid transport system substrate-binding protein